MTRINKTKRQEKNMKHIKSREGKKKYLMIYRERAFGEEKESLEIFTEDGLINYFKHYANDNLVKIHLLKEL